MATLQWRHNERDGVSHHRRFDLLFNRLFRRRSKKTSKFAVIGLREGNLPVTGGFFSERVSSAENVSIWWRHHDPTDSCFIPSEWPEYRRQTIVQNLLSLSISDQNHICKIMFRCKISVSLKISSHLRMCKICDVVEEWGHFVTDCVINTNELLQLLETIWYVYYPENDCITHTRWICVILMGSTGAHIQKWYEKCIYQSDIIQNNPHEVAC